MEQLNFNEILDRNGVATAMQSVLQHFHANKSNLNFKRGIYVYGAPGSGKTEFVIRLLKDLNYDVIKYDAGDIRNKSIIDAITKHNMSDKNVLSLFYKTAKPIAIVMDEIDGMNNGDKGGINSLIRLIRPKKTKKQKLEEITFNPIICISSYHVDKKIKELMKVCHTFELKSPVTEQMQNIVCRMIPTLTEKSQKIVISYLQSDLRKLTSIYKLYLHNEGLINDVIQNIFQKKCYNEDTKEITKKLLHQAVPLSEHLSLMNETDRTIVGLLWHENIVDVIAKHPKNVAIPFYTQVLNNICFADYIDRITFQKQIWQFNEMSSLIKTLHTNRLLHKTFKQTPKPSPPPSAEMRFTKVLTKYSTEYNNSLFIQQLCQQMGLDKKDMFSFFLDLRNKHTGEDFYKMFECYEINKLDINRIYRYLDKYTDKNCKMDMDECIEEELFENGGEMNE